MKVNDCLVKEIKDFLGDEYFENLNIEFEFNETPNIFYVKKEGNEVLIKYNNISSLCRGLTLVKENHHNDFFIDSKREFNTDGLMLDVSRNAVMKPSKVKEFIKILACFGLNRLMLYTEDIYEMKKYPFFGYMRGRYSKDEIKDIVSYAEHYGVEVIPCIQTLGHLERPLRWQPFDNVRDTSTSLIPEKKETYEFIEEMIKTSRECYKSDLIHIGMDEVFELGLGSYLRNNGYKDGNELFIEHLAKVIKICEKYGFKPMIWSDMFFRLNNEVAEYYDTKPLPDKIIKLIPENISLVYWDYYHQDESIYDGMIKSHLQTKRNTLFAGGAWKWTGFTPSIEGSFKTSIPALMSMKKNNIKDVFITAWGDNGSECPFFNILPVLALYSNYDYFKDFDNKKISSLLEAVTGETLDRMLLLDLNNKPNKEFVTPSYNPAKYFFYQEPFMGLFDTKVKDSYSNNYKDFAAQLEKAAKESKNYGYLYQYQRGVADVLVNKVDLGVRIRKAYEAKDKETLNVIANKEIDIIISKIDNFENDLENYWFRENKAFGFECLSGRLGFLKNRLSSVKVALNKYVSGEIEKIDQLEEKVLPFNGIEEEVCWNTWRTIVTAGDL